MMFFRDEHLQLFLCVGSGEKISRTRRTRRRGNEGVGGVVVVIGGVGLFGGGV